jgi:class 3 adenylate cyclase
MNPAAPVVEKVLTLLRQYGWEVGARKLEEEVQAAGQGGEGEAREFFAGWLAAERGNHDDAARHFQAVAGVPALAGWVAVGQAFLALRRKDFRAAHRFLDDGDRPTDADDPILQATRAHVRGSILFHEGKPEEARLHLLQAFRLFGPDHFGTGRVLDTLGMFYAGADNFHAARAFFARALAAKERHDDRAGMALTHGQLGRLYLDWGFYDKAEHHFQEDLHIAQQIKDERGQAQIYNFLGQTALARGERDASVGRYVPARRAFETAAGWLDAAIRLSTDRHWPVLEAFGRKDRALVSLAQGRLEEAESQAREAEEIFRSIAFAEGLAHVRRVWGMLHGRHGRHDEARTAFQEALRHFTDSGEPAEAARTQFEYARLLRAAGEPLPLVRQELSAALHTAERCRRAELVRLIEEVLQAVDPEAHAAHVCRRVRGKAVSADTSSLLAGTRETVTVLYLDLEGSTDFALGRDPEEVLLALNQMMADMEAVLRRHDAHVSAFRGDGFMALLREADHAVRAVAAGLDLFAALERFNEPRRLLGLPVFSARVGIASGEVCLGNVGTYDKMDYTAIGTTANLGARLETVAEPGHPCISRQTRDLVRDRFRYKEGSPRVVDLKGLGKQEVWDVAGREGTGTRLCVK